MLRRLGTHLLLILVFAFTQMGVATHEISHLAQNEQRQTEQHRQQDKNTPAEQCAQCIAYAQVASGLQAQPFVLPILDGQCLASTGYFSNTLSRHSAVYSARAPPLTLNS